MHLTRGSIIGDVTVQSVLGDQTSRLRLWWSEGITGAFSSGEKVIS